ncbi:unnamed protein product [Ectocarpus sp. CCAP 1310/34]|nr:unnamed protein product [Ectocarpus sp. CCAP 1310/34]
MANPYTSEVPLPALREHFATAFVSYPNMTAGNAAIEQECALDPAMAELRQHLLRHRITFCVFDMDLTVTKMHTRGALPRDPDTMRSYLESGRATDAVKTMKLCRALGLTVGIATFQREVDDSAHIGGSHLVRRVLGAIGAGDLVSDRDVVALTSSQYSEMIRHQESYTKNDMIRVLFERRGEAYSPGNTLLIDDTRRNVEAFVRIGGHGLLVEGGQGLILRNAKVVEPSCTFVPGLTFSSSAHHSTTATTSASVTSQHHQNEGGTYPDHRQQQQQRQHQQYPQQPPPAAGYGYGYY